MAFRILANSTIVFHTAFVLFVVLGAALVARWRRLAWLHIPALAWGVWVVFASRVCPLTRLENWTDVFDCVSPSRPARVSMTAIQRPD